MNIPQRTIIFFSWLSVGIMQPVLSLLLLQRGATLATLSIAIGIYAVTVLIFEFPSGVFADVCGRKNAFLLSVLLNIGSVLTLLFSHSMVFLAAAMFMQGVSRAFSSGSLDALIIDDCLSRHGDDYTAKVTSQLAVSQTLGIAVGALAGGFIPAWNGYTLHLSAKIAFIAFAGVLCLVFVKEKNKQKSERVALGAHLRGCFDTVKFSAIIKAILLGVFAAGFVLIAVEIYWQPAYTDIADPRYAPLLGVICFIGFGSAAAGNLIMRKLGLKPRTMRAVYFVLKILTGAAVIVFAFQGSVPGFIIGYGAVYLMLGLTDIAEQTLLNNAVPSRSRASMLSLLSLTSQTGGLIASGFASIFIGLIGYGGIWIVSGMMIASVSCAGILLLGQTKNKVTSAKAEGA